MPRRAILSANEKQTLVAISDNQAEFIRHYSFSESDLSIIRQRRGDANRLGFAIQLCYRGRLREGAESYAKALASDILR